MTELLITFIFSLTVCVCVCTVRVTRERDYDVVIIIIMIMTVDQTGGLGIFHFTADRCLSKGSSETRPADTFYSCYGGGGEEKEIKKTHK